MKVGVGSRVESAEAPVSPRSSPPKLPDFRRGRGISATAVMSQTVSVQREGGGSIEKVQWSMICDSRVQSGL